MNRRIHQARQQTTYEVNGVRHDRLEDVPAEFRGFFGDKDRNGVPDVVDSLTQGLKSTTTSKVTSVRMETTSGQIPNDLRRTIQHELLRDGSRCAKIECCKCGYDLAATAVGGKCPECGTDVHDSVMAMIDASSWLERQALPVTQESRRRRALICGVISLMGFALLFVKCTG
jgi:hypothetical protein